MTWHIHFKNGKFNIWDTVTDAYILNKWVNEDTVRRLYIEGRLEEEKLKLKDKVKELIDTAKENGFCSVRFIPFQCKEEIINENIKLRQELNIR